MAASYRCAGVRPLHMLTPRVETQLVKQESPSPPGGRLQKRLIPNTLFIFSIVYAWAEKTQ